MDHNERPVDISDNGRFLSLFENFSERVCQAIRSRASIESVLSEMDQPSYVKTADGQILVANEPYQSVFSANISAVGRFGDDFLNKTVIPVSRQTDQMILTGCSFVNCQHPGHDFHGHAVRFFTYKRSLLGLGHPRFAILGVSRIVESVGGEQMCILSLAEYWSRFTTLESRDREIACQLSQGKPVKELAAYFDVSEKTIENRRRIILDRLHLNAVIDLVKLMVRLQDNGFTDFGL